MNKGWCSNIRKPLPFLGQKGQGEEGTTRIWRKKHSWEIICWTRAVAIGRGNKSTLQIVAGEEELGGRYPVLFFSFYLVALTHPSWELKGKGIQLRWSIGVSLPRYRAVYLSHTKSHPYTMLPFPSADPQLVECFTWRWPKPLCP